MSVCIENNQNNISPFLPTCEAPKGLSVSQVIAKAKFWINRSHQRKQLARLDERMLEDIGVNAEQLQREISKPFWK